MSNFSYFLPFLAYFLTQCSHVQLILDKKMLTTKMFVFWPNATVPFYVYPDHFDYEQSMAILSALADFNFKTCINFYPVLTAPKDGQHVLTFVNPNGIRRCKIKTVGHSNHFPHLVELGYDCLRSPLIEMMIMRALGLPFEHNRMSRTVYIDVLLQNVEPDAIELFTMDGVLPPVLRGLPYDINSVMHFEERDFSKNGHRTIKFKNPKMHQNRVGLTANDLRKIELVYGSECRTRDRQEKLEMCQAYPGLTRRKRDLKPNANRNLRVNRNITPPPSLLANSEEEKTQVEYNTTDAKTDDLHISLNALGIANETEYIKEQVFRVSALALENARQKYCNATANLSDVVKPVLNPGRKKGSPTDILGILEVVADYAQSLVDHAVKNLTTFCENSKSIEEYQQLCELSDKSRCPKSYRSSNAPPKMRRRREVSAMGTEDEDDRDKTVIDAGSAKSERGHEKRTGKYKTDNKKPRRFLKDIQYRENTPDSAASEELDEDSNVSLDKDGDPVVKEVDLKDTEIDTENKFKADEEERETEVEEDKEEFVKEAINEGLDSMLAGNNDEENDEKTASEEDGIDAEGKDTDVIDEVESQKETEEVDKEEGLDVAKSEEQSAKEVEEEEEIATVRPKKHKVREQVVDLSVDSNDERDEYKPKKKEKKEKEHSKKRKISHANLPKTVKLNKLNKEFYKERRWPDGIVRYVIKKLPGYDLEDLRNRLAEVNNILLKKTCVKLVEVDSKEARGYDDYLVLDNSPDYVTGRVGGKQIFGCVELFKGDQHIQHTAMMVMAMLGFYFEVSRHDRDRHIRVHMRHIRPEKLHHFEKIREEATLALPYDYKSATHPAWKFWRKIGKTGISTVATYKDHDPDGSIMRSLGQNQELLSEGDIIKINSVYGVHCFLDKKESERMKKYKHKSRSSKRHKDKYE